jgi:hypothetical protein
MSCYSHRELADLQSLGNCTGVTILSSLLQVAPNWLVSDGRLLFWTTSETPGLLAMPVDGGAITILLAGAVGGNFLAVDDVNVYVMQFTDSGKMNGIPLFRIIRIPKKGGTATLVNESGAEVLAATTLGTTAYWLEAVGTVGSGWDLPLAMRSGSLKSGSISLIAKWTRGPDNPPDEIGVTRSTAFLVEPRSAGWNQQFFSMSAGPAGEEPIKGATACNFLVSDTDAAYCSQTTGSNLRVANDGTRTSMGAAISSSYIVFDDTYAYWADMASVGTIMKAPKAGGGAATVLARDTSPTAIAVDAKSVYWSDVGGYIKRIPK